MRTIPTLSSMHRAAEAAGFATVCGSEFDLAVARGLRATRLAAAGFGAAFVVALATTLVAFFV